MIEWYLVSWLFINGQWIKGDDHPHVGWSARKVASKADCINKLNIAYDSNKHIWDRFNFTCEKRRK